MSRKYRITAQTEENGYPEYEVVLDDKVCPYCRSGQINVNSSSRLREFSDVDEDGNYRKVGVRFPRYKCKNCGRTWSPLPKNLAFSYTPEFKERLIDLFYDSELTVPQISQQFHIKEQNVRKFLRDYISGWDEKKSYVIPSEAGLFRLDTPAGPLYGLVDVSLGTLLDLAEEKELAAKDWENVEHVYLNGFELPGVLLEKISEDRLVFPDTFGYEDGLDALEADAKERGIELEDLRQILFEADTTVPYDQIVKFPALMPIVLAAKNLKSFAGGKEPLETPDTELKNYLEFYVGANQLKPIKERSVRENDNSALFIRLADGFLEENRSLNKKFNTADKIRGKLLYGEQTQAAVYDPRTGELLLNFGKKLGVDRNDQRTGKKRTAQDDLEDRGRP